MTNNINAKA